MKLQQVRDTIFTSGRKFIANPILVSRPRVEAYPGVSAYEEFLNKLELLRIVLNKQIRVCNGLSDGRLVSQQTEVKATSILLDAYPSWVLGKSDNRAAGDVYIKTKGGIFPVNVKFIVNNSTSYNNICGTVQNVGKLLYGKHISSFAKLAYAMRNDVFTDAAQQYGVLAINKGTGETKSFTMFNIAKLAINPSNGFQFDWNTLSTVPRTQREGQEFLYNQTMNLLEKKAAPFNYIIA
jgi:hypothetical protein